MQRMGYVVKAKFREKARQVIPKGTRSHSPGTLHNVRLEVSSGNESQMTMREKDFLNRMNRIALEMETIEST